MPVSFQIERLRQSLAAERLDASVALVELVDLEDAERHAALDAIVIDEPSPYVIVGGRLVCTGSVDPAAVLAALRA